MIMIIINHCNLLIIAINCNSGVRLCHGLMEYKIMKGLSEV